MDCGYAAWIAGMAGFLLGELCVLAVMRLVWIGFGGDDDA